MALESATHINELDEANPAGADVISQGDNHLRQLKDVVKRDLDTNRHWIYISTATYATTSTFTVADASEFHVGRRVKLTGGLDRWGTVSNVSSLTITVADIVDSTGTTATLHSNLNKVFVGPSNDATSPILRHYPPLSGETGVAEYEYSPDRHDVRRYGATTSDLSTGIAAAVDSLPSDGGDVFIPDGTWTITEPILDDGKRVRFILSQGAIIKPSVDTDVFRITGHSTKILGGKIDGGDVASGSGNGIVIGYGGANSILAEVETHITDMRGHGLVWEHGPSFRCRVLVNNCDGDGLRFTENYTDNNHGQIIAHCSNNGGYGLNIVNSGTLANRSRHHNFLMVKAFGNTAGGIIINSHSNTGSIFMENNTGNQLEFGANGYGNILYCNGISGIVDSYTDASTGNLVFGVDQNNEPSSSKLQAIQRKLRNPDYVGSLEDTVSADYVFNTLVKNTNLDARWNIEHGGTGTLTVNIEKLKINSGNAELYFFAQASATLNFGTIAANSTSDQTITVTGALTNRMQAVAWPSDGSLASGLMISAFVSAPDTVTVRLGNITGAGIAVNEAFRCSVMSVDEVP